MISIICNRREHPTTLTEQVVATMRAVVGVEPVVARRRLSRPAQELLLCICITLMATQSFSWVCDRSERISGEKRG